LPDTVVELSEVAVKAQHDAKAHREAQRPDEAEEAAKRSEAAAAKLIEIVDALPTATHEHKGARRKAVAAAREARYFAELAKEEEQLADELASWKAKGFRAARRLAWVASFKALALAANQASHGKLESLPQSVQDSAELAADLANQFSGRERLPDGRPDWKGISTDLSSYSTDVPEQFSQFLSLALLLAGQKDLALYEIEQVDEEEIATKDRKLYFHLLHGIIYSLHDWQHLAVLEVEKISTEQNRESSEQLLAAVHLVLAYFYFDSKEYEAVDRETVRAMQIWPNNPVSVFLTGERLAATGEYEKAADSLEEAARGSEQEWIAQRIALRARKLRDQNGEGQTLLHDDQFMREVVLHYIWVAAKESEAAARINQSVENAKAFGAKMVQNLSGTATRKK
jgi:hypothetical protein